MAARALTFTRQLRTLLVLGRVSNLPTVWSNCLAGWILGGQGPVDRLALVCIGTTFLYVAGMYFNDAFDATFDRQHRPERPIPSGAISATAVWQLGVVWLSFGLGCLWLMGTTCAVLATLLALTVFVYDAVHKIFAFSPVLMAGCRFLLIVVAASVGSDGVTGLSVWTGLVLAAYVIGLSFLAQRESTQMTLRYWPLPLLLTPVVLAFLVNSGDLRTKAAVLSLILLIWVVRSLAFAFTAAQRNVGRSVSGLLAGIPLVDVLAVAPAEPWSAMIFLTLFLLALVFQQFVPAT
jgi:hypothetical protein